MPENPITNYLNSVIDDDFRDNNIGSNWVVNSGTTGAIANVGGVLRASGRDTNSSGTVSQVRSAAPLIGDFWIRVRMRRISASIGGSTIGFFLGSYNDADPTTNSGWQFGMINSGIIIHSRASSTWNNTWTGGYAPVQNNWYELRVERVGAIWKFYVDGTLVYTSAASYTGDVYFCTYRMWKENLGTGVFGDLEYDDIVTSAGASNAHQLDTLFEKTPIPVDSSTSFLAHYDISEADSLYGTLPVGVATSAFHGKFSFNNNAISRISVPINNSLAIADRATIEMFINISVLTKQSLTTYISFFGLFVGTTFTLAIGIDPSTGVLQLGGTSPVSTGVALDYGVSYHLAVTVSGGTICTLFLNGERMWSGPVTGIPAPFNFTTGTVAIGQGGPTTLGTKRIDAVIGDVRIWNIERLSGDIQQTIGRVLTGNESGLVGYWRLGEGYGMTAKDYSPKGNNGTLLSATEIEWADSPFVSLPNATLRPMEGKFGGGLAVEVATQNAIGNGDLDDGTLPDYETGSANIGSFTVVPSPIMNPILSANVVKVTPYVGTTELELHPRASYVFPGAGKYTLSCYIWVSEDWDGVQSFLHSRWYNGGVEIIGTSTSGGFPTKRGVWERISVTTDTGATAPTDFAWYFGYSATASTKGVVYATGFQVEYNPFPTSFVPWGRPFGYVDYPFETLDPSQGTVSFWVKSTIPFSSTVSNGSAEPTFDNLLTIGTPGTDGLLIKQIRSATGASQQFECTYWYGPSSTAQKMTANGPFQDYGWYMVTVSWGPSGVRFYLNGTLVGGSLNVMRPPSPLSQVFRLGRATSSGTYGPPSAIYDELRVDRVQRQDTDILGWYKSGCPFFPKGVHQLYA